MLSRPLDALPVRLDQYVANKLRPMSRAFASKLIDQGKVRVNCAVQTKAGYKLKPDDSVEIAFDPAAHMQIPRIKLAVIYEDDDCVVINKPVGLLSHSKGAFNPEPTVATWLADKVHNLSGERAGVVHRLDRATSGVMICAKNDVAQKWLQKQFATRKVKKTYLAVVAGDLMPPEAVIDMPIERHPKHPQTFRTGPGGRPAVTAYKVLESDATKSIVELRPTTGRTHQLRVHLAHLHHPIVGDTLYHGPAGERLLLHAWKLEITLPNKTRKTFMAPLPKGFTI